LAQGNDASAFAQFPTLVVGLLYSRVTGIALALKEQGACVKLVATVQVNQILVLEKPVDNAKAGALDRWRKQLETLHVACINKLE
jgi:hypothetical protein